MGVGSNRKRFCPRYMHLCSEARTQGGYPKYPNDKDIRTHGYESPLEGHGHRDTQRGEGIGHEKIKGVGCCNALRSEVQKSDVR